MRPPTLQYLYLQKPLTLILIIAGLALLPWLAVDSGISHTIVTYFGALAFIGYSFVFMGRRLKLPEVFTASLVLITALATLCSLFNDCFEMFYVLCMLIAAVSLFKWEESKWKQFPWAGLLALSLATLYNGWFSLILVAFVFALYATMAGNPFKEVIKRTALVVILPAIIPAAFFLYTRPHPYWLYPPRTGSIDKVLYYFPPLIFGFALWIIYSLFSVFGISPSAAERRRKKENRPPVAEPTETERKVYLFSIIVTICAFVGFSTTSYKKEINIVLIFPFLSLLIARYATFLTEYRTRVTRIFGYMLLLFSLLINAAFLASAFGVSYIFQSANSFIGKPSFWAKLAEIAESALTTPTPLSWALFSVLLFAQGTTIYQLSKKVNIKILYSCIGLYLAISLFFYTSFFLGL